MLFSQCRFPLWYAPLCPQNWGGGHNANLEGTLKKFAALCARVYAPNFKTVSAPMSANGKKTRHMYTLTVFSHRDKNTKLYRYYYTAQISIAPSRRANQKRWIGLLPCRSGSSSVLTVVVMCSTCINCFKLLRLYCRTSLHAIIVWYSSLFCRSKAAASSSGKMSSLCNAMMRQGDLSCTMM